MAKSMFKKVIKNLQRETVSLVETSLSIAGQHVRKELMVAIEDTNLPPALLYEKATAAVKSGLQAAGQEIVSIGLNRVRGLDIDTQDRTPNA